VLVAYLDAANACCIDGCYCVTAKCEAIFDKMDKIIALKYSWVFEWVKVDLKQMYWRSTMSPQGWS
jgi:hypothetical protein